MVTSANCRLVEARAPGGWTPRPEATYLSTDAEDGTLVTFNGQKVGNVKDGRVDLLSGVQSDVVERAATAIREGFLPSWLRGCCND